MTFIRKKTIKGKIYYYLVETKKIDGRVIQKVIKYLGNAKNLSK